MRVILGVTGCIAAYKSAQILRLLQKQGCEILPVMTEHAGHFIGSLTLEKLSGNPVVSDLFDDHTVQIEHIALARKAQLLLIAPATANMLAKFAHGIADDFLSTLYVSTLTPVVVAPAMNVEMWRHEATRENLRILEKRGVTIVEPEAGYLACGEVGEGRLAEPERIVDVVLQRLHSGRRLAGRKVLVSAGPTIEDIDPVRFLSNRSSGKTGYAIAAEAAARGAVVTLVSGPTHLSPPPSVEMVSVRSAQDMADAVFSRYGQSEIVIMAAAVSDFRPALRSSDKIKKDKAPSRLELESNLDILAELGRKKGSQLLIGFAAESGPPAARAREKLVRKNLDLIVANDISVSDGGFGSDKNQVTLIDSRGGVFESELLTKRAIAALLWDRIENFTGGSEREFPATRDKWSDSSAALDTQIHGH